MSARTLAACFSSVPGPVRGRYIFKTPNYISETQEDMVQHNVLSQDARMQTHARRPRMSKHHVKVE